MIDSYVAQIAQAQEAADALAEHQRLERLASSLDGLKAAQQKQQELDRLWDELCQAQTQIRGYVAEAAVAIPAWRERFAAAHEALLAVAHEVDQVQAPLVLGGDALHRAYRIEKKIQGLEGREIGSTVQKMWASAGGNSADLDPLHGLADQGLPAWFRGLGHKFLYSHQLGVKHFFRS